MFTIVFTQDLRKKGKLKKVLGMEEMQDNVCVLPEYAPDLKVERAVLWFNGSITEARFF